MMEFLENFGNEGSAIGGLIALLLLAIGFIRWLFTRKKTPKVEVTNLPPPAPPVPPDAMLIGIEAFSAMLKRERDVAGQDLAKSHGEERKRLEDKIETLNQRLANPEEALAQQLAIITQLEERLAKQGNQIGGDQLAEANAALERFDYAKARELFEQIFARTAPDVQTNADAAYSLGLIAEVEIRWRDAARHFATAASLKPTYDTLKKASDYAERSGDYDAALGFSAALLKHARANEPDARVTAALNEHAINLQAQGRDSEAEALYTQALEIDRKTIGDAHPSFAIHLNNLAGVVRAQGRDSEAEALYTQALDIDRKTIGDAHPNFATSLGNLAGVVEAQGRYGEAEALYTQVLEIGRKTIGDAHPDFATHLGNLAGVVQAQGRYAEAEALYTQALEIDRKTIGNAHPDFAIHLNNLAIVVETQGRLSEAAPLYAQAIQIAQTTLGNTHPNTQSIARNYLRLLETQNAATPSDDLTAKITALKALITP